MSGEPWSQRSVFIVGLDKSIGEILPASAIGPRQETSWYTLLQIIVFTSLPETLPAVFVVAAVDASVAYARQRLRTFGFGVLFVTGVVHTEIAQRFDDAMINVWTTIGFPAHIRVAVAAARRHGGTLLANHKYGDQTEEQTESIQPMVNQLRMGHYQRLAWATVTATADQWLQGESFYTRPTS